MPLQRCYSLISATRPVAMDLITRFVSRSTRLKQCLPKDADKVQGNIKIIEPTVLASTETVDGNCTLGSHTNIDNNANAIPAVFIQPTVARPPNEDFLDDSDMLTLPKALDMCKEDLSDIGPNLTPTFTFAKYANDSPTIQQLVKLGVKLYKLESDQELVKFILSRDFERDIKPYIRFLHDCGVPADDLGEFLTKNPYILKEDMDDLHTRIRYLRAHRFTADMIRTIVCKNPKWLLYTTTDIDGRLGYFQNTFKLNGQNVRLLTVKAPKVVTYKMLHLISNTLTIKEDMGFNPVQTKMLLLKLPRIWTKNRERLLSTFDYAHDEMQLTHEFILEMAHVLLCRKSRLQQRHMFLVELKRAQYDPTKPMYISPRTLITGTDTEFCTNVANAPVHVYNAFQKVF